MQYSTNSNAAILGEIRSACTPIGQYRKAALIARDKEHILETYRLERKRQDLKIEALKLRIAKAKAEIDNTETRRLGEIQIEEWELEIAQLDLEIAQAEPLLEDVMRELWIAKNEMQRLCDEAQINFGELPAAEFQELMTAEYRDRQSRHQLAGIYAAQVGVPTDRLEALLELPQDELLAIAARLKPMLDKNPIALLGAG